MSESSFVFLNIHTNYNLCLNSFILVKKREAKIFIDNLKILNKFVKILSVGISSCRDSLGDLKIKTCKKIELHDVHDCKLCDSKEIEQEEINEGSLLPNNETIPTINEMIKNKQKIFGNNNDIIDLDIEMFESVMLYCILYTLYEINEYVHIIINNTNITKIRLFDGQEYIYDFELPTLIYNEDHKKFKAGQKEFFWIDPKKRFSTKNINTINKLIEILKYVRENNNCELILDGHGEYIKSKKHNKGKKSNTKISKKNVKDNIF